MIVAYPSPTLLAVTPAKAGVHLAAVEPAEAWIPAFAGMTPGGM
jgi:hypothetical protein